MAITQTFTARVRAKPTSLLCPWDFPEVWSGLPFPSPEDLDPGIKFASPALATGFFTPEPPAEALSPSQNKTKPQTREPKAQRGEEDAQPPAGAIQSGRCRDRDGHRWAFKSSPVTLRPCSPQRDPAATANAGSSFSGGHLQLAECCHATEGTSLQSHGAGTCLGAVLVMARPGATTVLGTEDQSTHPAWDRSSTQTQRHLLTCSLPRQCRANPGNRGRPALSTLQIANTGCFGRRAWSGGGGFCCCFSGLANSNAKRASAVFTNRKANEDYLHFGKKQNLG